MRTGLYVHVPFCRKKCTYCAFVTRGVTAARVERVLAALHREIDMVAPRVRDRAITSVFLGGGTPTVLSARQIGELFAHVHRAFRVAADAEITCEANPEGVTDERLAALRAGGVNRLSIGAQSAVVEELRAVNRTHDAADVRAAVARARAAGIQNLSVDLLFGLPGQTLATWALTLDAYLHLGTPHVSLYGLTLETGTVLERQVARGLALPSDDFQATCYEEAADRLTRQGFEMYEISNAAHPGWRSAHNVGYWRRDEYAAIGPGAHAFLDEERTANASDVFAYADRVLAGASPIDERETIPLAMRAAETMFLGLRLLEGVDLDAAGARLGLDLARAFAAPIAAHRARGTLLAEGTRVRLDPSMRFTAHEVLADFLEPALTAADASSPSGPPRRSPPSAAPSSPR